MDIQGTGAVIENESLFDRTPTYRAVAAGVQEEPPAREAVAPMEPERVQRPDMAVAPQASDEAQSAASSPQTGGHVNLFA